MSLSRTMLVACAETGKMQISKWRELLLNEPLGVTAKTTTETLEEMKRFEKWADIGKRIADDETLGEEQLSGMCNELFERYEHLMLAMHQVLVELERQTLMSFLAKSWMN